MSIEGDPKKTEDSYEKRLERLRDELTGPSVSEVIQQQKQQQRRLFSTSHRKHEHTPQKLQTSADLSKDILAAHDNTTVIQEDDIMSSDNNEKYEI